MTTMSTLRSSTRRSRLATSVPPVPPPRTTIALPMVPACTGRPGGSQRRSSRPALADVPRSAGRHDEAVVPVVAVVEHVAAAGLGVDEEQEGLAGRLKRGGRLAQRQARR